MSSKQSPLYWSRCGHGQHWLCLKRRLLESLSLACGRCGVEMPQEDADSLRQIMAEATHAFEQYATEIELHVSAELRLRRAVKLLHVVPQVIFNFDGLRTLDLTAHPITVIPSDIGRLHSIKRLVLISCHIRELPEEVCDLPHLEQMLLCSNQLQGLPARLSNNRNLWRLYLDANELTSLPDPFPLNADSLKVSGNKLTHLPEGIGSYHRILDIQAYGNRLTYIPDSVCNLPKLRHLMLHGNRLRALPESIGRLPSLESLLLHDNCLERLPDSIVDLPRLEWLYVYNNKLKELPQGLGEGSGRFSRLLIEANPISAESLDDLFSSETARRLRVFGVDEDQVRRWRTLAEPASTPKLPRNCAVGRMLPWGRLYAKLMPGAQLAGSKAAVAEPAGAGSSGSDVLIVAFSASQGEPEWMGILGQIGQKDAPTIEESRRRIDRGHCQGFHELYQAVHGEAWEAKGSSPSRVMASFWHEYCSAEVPPPPDHEHDAGTRLRDFDVLCLCDSNAQWYYDREGEPSGASVERLEVERKLRSLVAGYRRVMFLGVSMGGFAALEYAHLADTVAVFGPQIDLTLSHLRPGMDAESLAGASRLLRDNLHRALARGTRIEYHVAMEDHLLYARRLRLPPGCLIVHPVHGRIARVLDRTGALKPLLIDLIAELQVDEEVRPITASQQLAAALSQDAYAAAVGWEWQDDDERSVTIAKWKIDGGFSLVAASPFELGLLMTDCPAVGAWYCTSCSQRNEENLLVCGGCGSDTTKPQHKVGWMSVQPNTSSKAHLCSVCGTPHPRWTPQCKKCSGVMDFTCGFCGKFGRTADGRGEPIKEEWYCHECWTKFDQHNRTLAKELPEWWFVAGGCAWTWRQSQGAKGSRVGQIEFDRGGKLITTWGNGSWKRCGAELEVSFGQPVEGLRMVRTADGFSAWPLAGTSAEAVASGRPIYGMPRRAPPAAGSGAATLQALGRALLWGGGADGGRAAWARRCLSIFLLGLAVLLVRVRVAARLAARARQGAALAPRKAAWWLAS